MNAFWKDYLLFSSVLFLLLSSLTRWLSTGPDGKRFGYTSDNILKPEHHGIDLASLGVVVFNPLQAQSPSTPDQTDTFSGGESGGGGASEGF